jgi:hypothetical protein
MRSPFDILRAIQVGGFYMEGCTSDCVFCGGAEKGHGSATGSFIDHKPGCVFIEAVNLVGLVMNSPLPTFCKHCGAFIPGAKSQTSFCPKPATCRKDHRKAVNAAKYSDLKRRARGPKPLAVVPYDQLGHAAISLPVAPPKGVTHLALVPVRQKTKKPGLQPTTEAPNA